METVQVTPHEVQTEVVLTGPFGIAQVRSAYVDLSVALTRKMPLTLQTAGLERVDCAGLQLLLALTSAARAQGITVHWDDVNPRLRAGAEQAGLVAALGFNSC